MQKSQDATIAAIEALDLEPIKFKLMEKDDGYGWSRERADAAEVAYKRFLTLLVKYPDQTIAPTREIDKFWHGHILDTMKYQKDCQEVFGYFLHHFPYFGLRGEEDAMKQAEASQALESLYVQEFGQSVKGSEAYCMDAVEAEKAAYCMAAKPKAESAYCMAAVEGEKAAYCMAAKPGQSNAAYCMAAKPKVESAYCMAAVEGEKAAYCMAAKPGQSNAAYCMAAKPEQLEAA